MGLVIRLYQMLLSKGKVVKELLVNITRPPYIFFSSTKSEFVRFIEYIQTDKVDNWQALMLSG